MTKQKTYFFDAVFVIALIANLTFWLYAKDIRTRWANVPPVPSHQGAMMMALSDKQLAYRLFATILQNIGNTGGRQVKLTDYNYESLKDWFFLQDSLDPQADITPFLATNYFGAIQDSEKLDYILEYLAEIGQRPFGDKWRWLAHGVYIARHIQKDNERALELARILADNKNPDIGIWAKQMPAFILQSEGNIEESSKIMINILKDNAETLDPAEINFMLDYICNTLLDQDKTLQKPDVCDSVH